MYLHPFDEAQNTAGSPLVHGRAGRARGWNIVMEVAEINKAFHNTLAGQFSGDVHPGWWASERKCFFLN